MTRPMRILLSTDSYPPMIGGAGHAVRLLAIELAARGHEVSVATVWQRGLPASERLDGIDIHRVRDASSRVPWVSEDPHKHHVPPFPDPEAVHGFGRLLRQIGPEVVHSYGWLTYSLAAALRDRSVPLVLSVRDWGNFCALRTLLQDGVEPCSGPAAGKCLRCAARWYGPAKGAVATAAVLGGRDLLARRLAGVHFNSTFTQSIGWEHLLAGRARFAPRSPLDVVIPNFLAEPDGRPPDEEILARLPDSPYILFVGAFRRVKGLPELFEAYGRLPDAPPLVLIGTRESDTPEHFPPGVTILESVPHATVLATWRRALFGVFPSTVAETFGNVVHEAMSQGRPVIGTRPSGHESLIEDGRTGFLVARGNVDELTEAMRRLIESPELRSAMGAAATASAISLSAEHAVPRFEALYENAIGFQRARDSERAA